MANLSLQNQLQLVQQLRQKEKMMFPIKIELHQKTSQRKKMLLQRMHLHHLRSNENGEMMNTSYLDSSGQYIKLQISSQQTAAASFVVSRTVIKMSLQNLHGTKHPDTKKNKYKQYF